MREKVANPYCLLTPACVAEQTVSKDPWPPPLLLWLVRAQEGPCSLRLARGACCCLHGSLIFTQQVCLRDRDGSSGVEEPLA